MSISTMKNMLRIENDQCNVGLVVLPPPEDSL